MPIDPSRKFIAVNIAVLTVSDTRDASTDRAGQILQERIEASGHRCVARVIVRDEADGRSLSPRLKALVTASPAATSRPKPSSACWKRRSRASANCSGC